MSSEKAIDTIDGVQIYLDPKTNKFFFKEKATGRKRSYASFTACKKKIEGGDLFFVEKLLGKKVFCHQGREIFELTGWFKAPRHGYKYAQASHPGEKNAFWVAEYNLFELTMETEKVVDLNKELEELRARTSEINNQLSRLISNHRFKIPKRA